MRKLNLVDAFKVARILRAADIKEEFSKLATKFVGKEEKPNLDEVGLEVILTLISAAGEKEVENQIYDLIAGIKECQPEEVKNLSLDGLKSDVKTIIEQNDLKSFFKSASNLT